MPTPRFAHPGRRQEIEADLADKYHVEYVYRINVDTAEFDIDKSLANQARNTPLDPPTVELYKEAVERGDDFPAVVAYRPGRSKTESKLVIIDGNHRLAAHMEAGKPIAVYEVDRTTKTQTIILMTYALNTKHGRPTTEEERTTQAMYLIDAGATYDAAAAAVGVPVRIVRRAAQVASAERRADDAGVNRQEWEALSKPVRSRLNQISTDEGLAAAAHLTYAAGLNTDELAQLTVLVNTSRSGAKQRSIVREQTAQYQDRIQTGAGGVAGSSSRRAKMTPRSRVSMLLGQAMGLGDDLAGLASLYAEPEKIEVAGKLMEASQKMHKLALALNPSVR